MPSASKNAGAAPAAPEPPFEEALRKLESIVEQMEGGELPLETMLTRFEEGVRLVKSCQTRLDEAELKISTLEKSPDGEAALKPAHPALTDDE